MNFRAFEWRRGLAVWMLMGLIVSTVSMGYAFAQEPSQETEKRKVQATDLAWMAGCWQSLVGDPGSGEHWSPPAGGTLIGSGRTVKGTKTVAHEFMVIKETDEGGLVYVAAPAGQEGAVFLLVGIGVKERKEVIFQNPKEGFPHRIFYRMDDKGRLLSRMEGTIDGEKKGVDFPMTPVACK